MRRRYLIPFVASLIILLPSCGGDEIQEVSSGEETAVATATTEAVVEEVPDTKEVEEVTEAVSGDGLVVLDGDSVEVHYVGTLDDGSQFDSSRDRGTPFTFTVGAGQVISGFDEAVRGGSVGDINTVRMEPEDAYGVWSEENVIELPLDPEQGEISVGDEVVLSNGQPAVIYEVTDETVKLDVNHRLAGEALTFEIEILSITRE